MSVLIKGIDMPKVCALCPFREIRYKPGYYNYEHCSALNNIFNECKLDIDPYKEKLDDCPLIEIPTPHGRLIDADKVFTYGHWEEQAVNEAPTILEAEE